MSDAIARSSCAAGVPRLSVVVTALGVTQILSWGSSYYLPAVLATPIVAGTGWPLECVVGGLSIGLVAAGLVSPMVGNAIQRRGGRSVLALSSLFFAAGLVGVALAESIVVYLAAWIIVGFGMGAGLYDAAFATIGHLYRQNARGAIATLTLFGGFASAICWPLSAFLVERFGWRGACCIYAGLHVIVALPIYLLLLPSSTADRLNTPEPFEGKTAEAAVGISLSQELTPFCLLAAGITLGAMISSVLSIHLLTILQDRGLGLAVAVGLGALVGPSQVGARLIQRIVGIRFHPIWTMAASTFLVAVGITTLLLDSPLLALGLVFYGAGIGIMSIARGTVPLALSEASAYASLMGRLALPSLLAQAVAPFVAALLLRHGGGVRVLSLLTVASFLNIVVVGSLWRYSRRTPSRQAAESS